jgi:hypothetical protein
MRLSQPGGIILRLRLGFGDIVTSEIEAPNNYVSESRMQWMSGRAK